MSSRTLPRTVRLTLALIVLVLGGSMSMQAFVMSTAPAVVTALSVAFCAIVIAAVLVSPDIVAGLHHRRLAAAVRNLVRTEPDESSERVVSEDEITVLLADDHRPEIDPRHLATEHESAPLRRSA